jgi:protease-4
MYGPPPPTMMMPPPFYPPPPSPRGGGFARAIFVTLATSIFGLSIALNVYMLGAWLLSSDENVRQTVLVPGDSKQTVAVVQLNGILEDRSVTRFEGIVRKLETDSDIKALVLEIDTPGGSVSASDEIYHRILQYKEKTKVPVVVSMGGMATSGGYYISCAADKIVAERTTITGNIGVLMPRYNFAKLADKYGVEDTTLHSTGSEFKDAGSMFRPERPEERAYWLGLIDDAYATFKGVVQTGRGNSLKAPMTEVANGKAYTSNEALKMGLIDAQGYATDAYTLAASMASLSNKHVVRFDPVVSLLGALAGDSEFGGASPSAKSISINGVEVSVDRHFLEDLATPRLMYLWRGE